MSNQNYKTLKNPLKLSFKGFFCDLGRIQTCNLLSRNQVHYSVMLRGLMRLRVQIYSYFLIAKIIFQFLF